MAYLCSHGVGHHHCTVAHQHPAPGTPQPMSPHHYEPEVHSSGFCSACHGHSPRVLAQPQCTCASHSCLTAAPPPSVGWHPVSPHPHTHTSPHSHPHTHTSPHPHVIEGHGRPPWQCTAPAVASPLHHSYSYHHPAHVSGFHTPQHIHRGTETHSHGCCPQHPTHQPKSVCQVNPTRRQLIPGNLHGDDIDSAPQSISEAATPVHVDPNQPSPNPPSQQSPLAGYARPLPPTPEPPARTERERADLYVQGYGGCNAPSPLPHHVYSTPLHQNYAHQQSGFDFSSPIDPSSGFPTTFELASHPTSLQSGNTTSNNTFPPTTHPPPTPPPPDPPSPPSPISESSVALGKPEKNHPQHSTAATTAESCLELPARSEQHHLSVVPRIQSDLPSTPKRERKIGREAVVLQHCQRGAQKMEPATGSGALLGGEAGGAEVSRDVKIEDTDVEGTEEEVGEERERVPVRETGEEVQDGGEESEVAESHTAEKEVVYVGRSSPVRTRSRTRCLSDTETSQSESELPSVSVPKLEQGTQHEASEDGRGGRVKKEVEEREEEGEEQVHISRKHKRSPIRTRLRRRCLTSDTETSQSETELPSSSQHARKKTRSHQRREEEAVRVGRRRGRPRKEEKEGQQDGCRQEDDSEDVVPVSNRLRSHDKEDDLKDSLPISNRLRSRSKGEGGDTSHSENEAPPTSASARPDEPEVEGVAAEAIPPKASGVRLREWYIKIVGKDLVLLEGKKNDDIARTWHSGPIVERLAARELSTRSGTVYLLEGPVSWSGFEKAGIRELARKFQNGFPKNWRDLVHQFLIQKIEFRKNGQSENNWPESVGEEEKEVEEAERGKTKRARRETSQKEGVTDLQCPEDQEEALDHSLKVKVESDLAVCATPQLEMNSNSTSDFVSSLKRSSRGRTIKPSAYTSCFSANISADLYSYDMCGNFIGMSSPVIDLTISESFQGVTSDSWKLVKHVKKEVEETGGEGKGEEGGEDGEEEVEGGGGGEEEILAEEKTRGEAREVKKRLSHSKKKSRVIPRSLIKMKRKKKAEEEEEEEEEGEKVKEVESRDEGATEEREKPTKKPALRRTARRGSRRDSETQAPKEMLQLSKKSDDPKEGSHDTNKRSHGSKNRARDSTDRSHDSKESSHGSIDISHDSRDRSHGSRGRGRPRKSGKGRRHPRILSDSETDQPEESHDQPEESCDQPEESCDQPEVSCDSRVKDVPDPVEVRGKGGGKVRGHHKKKSKKRVSISERVTVVESEGWDWGVGEDGAEGSLPWSAHDLQQLRRVVLAVPAMTEDFWEVVARKLGTGHAAGECSSQYAEFRKRQRKKTAGTLGGKTKQKLETPAITAKAGTLKRKRQIREVLDHLDQGYLDDLFDSTPFKKSRVNAVQLKGLEEQEEEEEEEERDAEGGEEEGDHHLIVTPQGAYQRLAAPSSHTPKLCDYLTTPDIKSGLTQVTADNVMYRKQKAKKRQKPLKPPSALPQSQVPGKQKDRESSSVSHQKLRTIHSGEVTVLRRFEDSDDSCDSNPFSDMEDACQDIIARLH